MRRILENSKLTKDKLTCYLIYLSLFMRLLKLYQYEIHAICTSVRSMYVLLLIIPQFFFIIGRLGDYCDSFF